MSSLASGPVRALLLAVGVALLAAFVWYSGPAAVAERLAMIGPWWPLLLVPSVLVNVLDALAWRYAFARGVKVSMVALFKARLAGEAVNTLTPSAYVGGEPVKAYCLAPGVPIREGLSSVIVGRTLMSFAHVAFIALGVAVAVGRFEGSGYLLAAIVALLAAAGLGLHWLVGRQKQGLVGWVVGLAARLGVRPPWLEARAEAIADLDDRVARFYRDERGRLPISAALYLAGWVGGTIETYAVLRLMGLTVDLPTAVAIEALTGAAKAATFMIPGSLGGQEAGNLLLFAGFGYPLAAAVSYSVLRRARELLWAGVGLALLARAGHPERRPPPPA